MQQQACFCCNTYFVAAARKRFGLRVIYSNKDLITATRYFERRHLLQPCIMTTCNKRASIEYRGKRKRVHFEFRVKTLPQMRAAFPLYYQYYSTNRKARLPKGWIMERLAQLDADFIAHDRTGTAPQFLTLFRDKRAKATWYAMKFGLLRDKLGDGIIDDKGNAKRSLGQPASMNREDSAARMREKKEKDEDFAIAQAVAAAECNDQDKAEKKEEKSDQIENAKLYIDHELLTRFDTTEALVNYLLRQCPFAEFPTSTHERAAKALPFGAKTVHEAINRGLQTPHFHYNFCTTTRDDHEGEFHGYLTNGNRNWIFHYATNPVGTPLAQGDVLDDEFSDLQFIPLFRYIGTEQNGFERLLIDVEAKSQTQYHKKVPVGTVGFRYDNAGQPVAREDCVCTLYFVFSVRKLLEKVEKGELKISPTGRGLPMTESLFNRKIWERSNWAPVEIP